MTRPYFIGLTGSIGMGKSETLKMFAALDIPVYSTDTAVHHLYDRGGAAVPVIEKAFPGVVRNGRVDRDELSKRVIGAQDAAERLESIVHPLLRSERRRFIESAVGACIVVFEIPLLFEIGADDEMDAIVVATASSHVQRARVLNRPGMTLEKFDFLRARQISDAEKRAKAHFVVVTDHGLDHAAGQVKMIVDEIHARLEQGANHA